MMLDMNPLVIDLEYRGTASITEAAGRQIDCLRGRIWITEQGLPGDIVLEAGESYEIAHSGVAVVQALAEAAIAVRAHPDGVRSTSRRGRRATQLWLAFGWRATGSRAVAAG